MSGDVLGPDGMAEPILPGATIGILGSGQLGRMLAGAAAALGYRVQVYSPEAGSPAGLLAAREVVGSYDDAEEIGAFAAGVDVLTFEFENLSSAAVAAAERHTVVRPGADVLATAQNRRAEKEFLGARRVSRSRRGARCRLRLPGDAAPLFPPPTRWRRRSATRRSSRRPASGTMARGSAVCTTRPSWRPRTAPPPASRSLLSGWCRSTASCR